jgi:hypothetical protein
LLIFTACSSSERYSLVDNYDEARTHYQEGKYPSFVEEKGPLATIDLSHEVRRSLTPPFPSRIVFEVDVPPAAFLEVSPALVMEQIVRRTRVEFIVWVGFEGERVEVYREPFRVGKANMWQHRRIDLTSWAGSHVELVLETRPIPDRQQVLWADRIQTVWGEPTVTSDRIRQAVTVVAGWMSSTATWFERQAVAIGMSADEKQTTFRFAISLILGGLAALFIRELYKRCGATLSNREEFANLFPLFTLTTIVVIFVVQASLALSLGLLGALSIVRFRSAIKSPEELVYLLFCVAVGLSLGANQVWLAMVAIGVVTLFILIRPLIEWPAYQRKLLLTVSGSDESFIDANGSTVVDKASDLLGRLAVERLDREGDRFQLRAVLSVDRTEDTNGLASKLKDGMPDFEFSFVDLDDVL